MENESFIQLIENQQSLVVVTGCTYGVGYYITQELLSNGFGVRAVVRSKRKLYELFQSDKFESVVEMNIKDAILDFQQSPEGSKQNPFNKIFQENQQKPQIIISCVGGGDSIDENQIQIFNEVQNKMLIDASLNNQIKKFVLISSDFVYLPYTYSALTQNYIWPYILEYKGKAENYLRESGLNYQIIRPGRYHGKKVGQDQVQNIIVSQHKNNHGSVTRASIGKVVVEALKNSSLPNKVTFECNSNQGQEQESYQMIEFDLNPDDENSLLKVDHKKARQNIVTVVIIGSFFYMLGAFCIIVIVYTIYDFLQHFEIRRT